MTNIITFCLLGQKGLLTLQGSISLLSKVNVQVVIGRDKNVSNDYSNDIEYLCLEHHLKFIYRGCNESHFYERSALVIAAGWRWLIKDVSAQKLIVFHDSLLPKYRGFAPLVNALLNKEEIVGVSSLFASQEYDEGALIEQRSCQVNYPCYVKDIIEDVALLYQSLSTSIVSKFLAGKLSAIEQEHDKASYSLWRDDEDYRIDWNQDAEEIAHFIRCVGFPYSGAYTLVDGKTIRIKKAEPVIDVKIENRTVGKLIFFKDEKPCVVCGTGILKLTSMEHPSGVDYQFSKFRIRCE